MKKVFVSAVITLLFVIILTGMRLATFPRTEASGKFITTSTTVHSTMEDKFNTIIELSSMVTYTGTLQGISVLQGTLTVRRDGSANFQGVETFTGLVNGTPGTLTFKIKGSNDLYQAIELNNVITNGTGELASFHGELFKDGIVKDNGPIGTYTGRIDNQ